MINLIIFILSFISWLILVIKNSKPTWYIYVVSFLWGFFLCQTIIGICGMPTIIDSIMK